MENRLEHDLFGTKPRNGGINSDRKGKENERDLCRWLEKWTGEKFARVPSSGGLRWKNTVSVCGDVVCENQDFDCIFSIETKHLKTLSVTGKQRVKSTIRTIWEKQAKPDAERAGKIPLMLLRCNGMKQGTWYFITDKTLPFDLVGYCPMDNGVLNIYSSKQITPYSKLIEHYASN